MTKFNNRSEKRQNRKVVTKKVWDKANNSEAQGTQKKMDWEEFNPEKINPDKIVNAKIGIVSKIIFDKIKVLNGTEIATCKLSTELPKELISNIVVGDKVMVNEDGKIIYRLPRQGVFSRFRSDSSRFGGGAEHVFASNVDLVIIVATVAEPEFKAGFIDRYLILCQNCGITPIICLNKVDLSDERHPILESYKTQLDIEIVETSVDKNIGFDTLKSKIKNKTVVLVGNSGVGKSSIVNKLRGADDDEIKTQEISKKWQQGKHTTTNSNLYFLEENNTYIIDTPGIRALGLTGIKKNELKYFFPEFAELNVKCKFNDCAHVLERDCAVKTAVENNEISEFRYRSYVRMMTD